MDACGQFIRAVFCLYVAPRLKDDIAFIVVLINIVNSDSRFLFFMSNNGFVYVVAIHALATKGRQQRRMDIDDAPRECMDERRWHLPHKSREDNQGGLVVCQLLHEKGFMECLLVDDQEWDVFSLRNIDHARLRIICDDERNSGPAICLEIIYNSIGISAGAGSEYDE